ncbi:hypothetical protein GLA29479_1400 [Lysobacter antibioticus]|nr:hypothetical protein GLA29479_1400 [Lysobacter antibioticus]
MDLSLDRVEASNAFGVGAARAATASIPIATSITTQIPSCADS